jgi:pyrimidine operon attenuation protein / uracil phosphoribosyltransferase
MVELLSAAQIRQKTERIAIQILERNYGVPELILIGINNNGMAFAARLHTALQARAPQMQVVLAQIRLNPAAPLSSDITLSLPSEAIANKPIIVIDDVANTGRTAYYALRPLLNVLCTKVEIAVLVDRKHKSFPAQPDYVGLSLATTLHENIEVRLGGEDEGAYMN